jgi:hypothetical protein
MHEEARYVSDKDHILISVDGEDHSAKPDAAVDKSRLQCAGLNRHEAEEEEASRERTSDPLGPVSLLEHRTLHQNR